MIRVFHSSRRRNPNGTRSFATNDDFQKLFAVEINDLFRLSLQLTANAEKAGRCLTLAMEDCSGTNTISRDFARVWVRRQIIRTAIHSVLGVDNDFARPFSPEFQLQPSLGPIGELRESPAILELPDLERLSFVTCVLERLSILDCALLLRKSPKYVSDAIMCASTRLASLVDPSTSAMPELLEAI